MLVLRTGRGNGDEMSDESKPRRRRAPRKPVTLTIRQIDALERAWNVLLSGYSSDRYNGGDFVKRHNARDRAAARIIDELLEQAGIDCDWYDS